MKPFQEFKNEEQLNEGLISYASDLITAFRIVKILYQDWTKTKAFKLGIIDAEGHKIKSPEGLEEKSAYSPFIRLVFRLKKLLGMIPGGSSKIGTIAAAYALLRESEDIDITTLTKEDLDSLFEDAPVNVAGGVAGAEVPNKAPVLKRKAEEEPKEPEEKKKLAENTFEVDADLFERCRQAKLRYDRWDKHILENDGQVGQDILKYARGNPGKGIVLIEKNENTQIFLKAPNNQ